VASLPIVAVASNLVTFVISLPLLLVVMLLEGAHPGASALFALPIVVVQFVLTLAVSYLVAGLNVAARDVQFIIPVLLQIGYYVTPIFYSLDKIPAAYRQVLSLSPLAVIIDGYRTVLIDNHAPDWIALLVSFVVSVVLLVLAAKYFVHASRRFLEDI
jgi:ABC-type polysaccharide/polyol phosphate export permease